MPPKRTSIAIDEETKQVLDWSMSMKGARKISKYIRKLLIEFHKKECDTENDGDIWFQLLKESRKANLICEDHGKPYTLICKSCEIALCPECRTYVHQGQGHNLQFFCNKHQVGYQTTCMLCERDRWEGIVDVPMITADDLKKELESNNIICIDVRGDSEWDEGYIPNSDHIKWIDFRLKKTKGHKYLENLVEKHRAERWIFISQGSPKYPGKPARAWLAAADVKTMYQVKNVACLEGGWSHFHEKFPDIIEYPKSDDPSQIHNAGEL